VFLVGDAAAFFSVDLAELRADTDEEEEWEESVELLRPPRERRRLRLPLDLDLSGDAAAMDGAPGMPLLLADFDGDDDGGCWAYRNVDEDFGIDEPVESDELREARERRRLCLPLDLDLSGDAAAMDEAPGIPLLLADFDGDDGGVC
jgi:hypothetical protein